MGNPYRSNNQTRVAVVPTRPKGGGSVNPGAPRQNNPIVDNMPRGYDDLGGSRAARPIEANPLALPPVQYRGEQGLDDDGEDAGKAHRAGSRGSGSGNRHQ